MANMAGNRSVHPQRWKTLKCDRFPTKPLFNPCTHVLLLRRMAAQAGGFATVAAPADSDPHFRKPESARDSRPSQCQSQAGPADVPRLRDEIISSEE